MKTSLLHITFLCFPLLLIPITSLLSQNNKLKTPVKTNWAVKNPFEQKVFIENKGQFDEKESGGSGKIVFSTSQQGIDMFWNLKGLTYKITEHYLSEEAKAEKQKGGESEEAMEKMQLKYHYLTMEWVGSNPNAEIISEDPVSNYFTYANPNDKSGKSGIKALAYKKITYKNIYPGIDAEYILPKKGGVKYSFIVHPGADPGVIKMRYTGAEKVDLNSAGEVLIISRACGTYIDHQPETYYEGGNSVASAFTIHDGIIGFNVPAFNKTQTLIIDPWVSVVSFPSLPWASAYANVGYDVGYDNSGNVWVYGGGDPLYLAKYDNGGTILWSYSIPLDATSLVGDFDVNKISGTAYICEGYATNGAKIVKVNSQGLQTALFPGSTSREMPRIRLDCDGKLFTVSAGTNIGGDHAGRIDTNLVTMIGDPVIPSPNGDHDQSLMTLDPSSTFMYMNFNRPCTGSADYLSDNELWKIGIPGFTPAAVLNPGPIYNFTELTSLQYAGGSWRLNMFNGMVCGNGFLYTSDGKTLKKWDKNTGVMLAQVNTGGVMFWSGGLDLDLCENVYAGVSNMVKEYDSNLNLISTYALPDTSCYDLKIDKIRNLLYACGKGYVCAIAIPASPVFQLTATSTPAVCTCNGTATANISTYCADILVSYSWTGGQTTQTTQTATGLCPGTYTVTVFSNCLPIFKDSVIVTGDSVLSTLTASTPACGSNGTATVSIITGIGPYTYSWSPSGQTTATAYGLGVGTYSVTVTAANGCSEIKIVTITSLNINAIAGPDSIICPGQTIVLTAAGGTNYSWSSGQTTASITIAPAVTEIYSVIVSNGSNCVDTAFVTITVDSLFTTITSTLAACASNNGSATVTVTSGSSPYTYSWSLSGGTGSFASGLSGGTYTVTTTDALGCINTNTVIVAAIGNLSSTITSTPDICGNNNGSAIVTISSGSPPFTYSWSPSGGTSSFASGLSAGNYIVTITDSNSCTVNDTVIVASTGSIIAMAGPDSTICIGQTLTINSSGGTNYSWSSGQTAASITIAPTVTTIYSVIVSSGSCVDTAFVTITVNPLPTISVSGNTTLCIGDIATLIASGGTTYLWNTGATTASISDNPPVSTSYNVVVTDANSCTDSTSINVSVSPTPIASVTSATICSGENATLIASGGENYLWSNGNTNSSINITPVATSSFTVIVSVGSCTDTANAIVTVNPMPTVALQDNQIICDGQNLLLNAGNPGAGYLWSTGETSQTINVSIVGKYWVIIALNNCIAKDSVTTLIAPKVHLFDSSLCTTSPILLNPGSGASSYLWSTGSTSQSISVDVAGNYWVVAIFGNCMSGDSAIITGDGNGGLLFIPNTFTPNDDNINEVFLAKGTGIASFAMSVFDRWGNLIFESDDINKGWNGKIQGGHYPLQGDGKEVAQVDVYVWKIDYTTQCFPNRIKKAMGIISIVK